MIVRDALGRDHPFHATTVGWMRIVKVDVEQAVSVQVRILDSRAEPYVTTSLY